VVEDVDLNFLGQQIQRLIDSSASMRDDMSVMMEILRRLETTVQSLGVQLTEMHAYNRRVEQRVHRLEEAETK
jgi:hypothetical protein